MSCYQNWSGSSVSFVHSGDFYLVDDAAIQGFTGAEVLRPPDVLSNLFHWFTDVPRHQLNLNNIKQSQTVHCNNVLEIQRAC